MMRVFSKKVLVAVLVLILIAGGAVLYARVHSHKKTVAIKTTKQGTVKTVTQPSGVKVTTTTNSSSNKGDGTTAAPAADTPPVTPYGTFVSNHRPNLSGSPAPNQENSVCQTTPGVTCEIRFTKDGETKTLGPSKVGSDGFVSWDWKLQDIGLTQGTWQIQAVARNGTKTATATDPAALEVGP